MVHLTVTRNGKSVAAQFCGTSGVDNMALPEQAGGLSFNADYTHHSQSRIPSQVKEELVKLPRQHRATER